MTEEEKITKASTEETNVDPAKIAQLKAILDDEGSLTKDKIVAEEKAAEENPPKAMPDDYRDKVYDPLEGRDMMNPGALAGIEGDIVTQPDDKQRYLKAVLNDEPVILTVALANGEFNVKIRSKSSWEQTLTYEAASADQSDKIVSDYYQALIQMQKYGVMIQVLEINGKPFQNKEYIRPKNKDWTKQREDLRNSSIEVLDNMNNVRMQMLLNALRIFEYKLADMTAACNNANFWEPVG